MSHASLPPHNGVSGRRSQPSSQPGTTSKPGPSGPGQVDCRHRRLDGRPLGSPVIHTLNGTARPVHNANIVIAVTNVFFATPAHELAAEQGIHLLFGERLRTWPMGGPPARFERRVRPISDLQRRASMAFTIRARASAPYTAMRREDTEDRRVQRVRARRCRGVQRPAMPDHFAAVPAGAPSRGATRPPPPDVLPGGGTGRPLDGEQCEAAASLRASYPVAVGRTEEPRPNHPVGAPLRL
ncbi:restriction endonuclease [Streptomyces sp. NPDC059893]|uniref:restriction endonuclease n=1 Tax=Streptomyces sp. NPDC059893 TaxID=3346990 RepID=UPI00364847F5